MSELQFRGPVIGTTGTTVPFTADITGAQRITDAHARYFDTASRGNVFAVCNQAGVTTQAGLSATTPALTLYNPAGSGVNGILLYAGYITTVAWGGAAVVWLGANTNLIAAAVTGTLTTAHRNGLLGGKEPAIRPFLAATLPAAPIAIATLGSGLTGAVTVATNLQTVGRQFDGSIVITPGSAISFQTSAASGASAFVGEFVWEEVPQIT